MKAAEMVLALAIVFTVAGVVSTARGRIRAHGFHVLAWRWLAGHHWSGHALTDAGWSRPGTKALTQNGHAGRWWYRPRRVRAACRSGATLAILLSAWGLLFARPATLVTLAGLALASAVGGVLMTVRWWRGRVHRQQWVQPAHLVAAPVVGLPIATDPYEWLTVARDRSRVVVMLPPAWKAEPADRARLVDVLTGRLAIEAPETRWMLAGPKPRLEITQSAPPPSHVPLADAMPAIKAAKEDEVVWGAGKRGTWVKTSLSGDSPHVGLSMGSGAGKSVTARSLLAQMLAKGAIGLVLDIKMISHQWAARLPNVVIARRPAEIHAALLWLGAEVDRRNEVALAGADEDGNVNADVGPRIIVVAEELNATMDRLKAYWRDIRTADDPKRSPAISALDAASFTGRQVLINLVYIGQRLSNAATGGGGDARENIGVIAFGRWRASTWKMLAPDFPMPGKNLTPGRLQVVSDVVRECQGILTTPAEARELALSGVVSPLPSTMPGAVVTAMTNSLVSGGDLGFVTGAPAPDPAPVTGAVTLREAVEAGILGMSLAAARQARQRDPEFPAVVDRNGTEMLYALAELAAWASAKIN